MAALIGLLVITTTTVITFNRKEKGLGISTESIGHLARNLASILIEDRNDVKARYTLFVPIFQRVFHNAESERALGLQKLHLLVRHQRPDEK